MPKVADARSRLKSIRKEWSSASATQPFIYEKYVDFIVSYTLSKR